MQYFKVIDLLINEIQRRFEQDGGMPVAALITINYPNAIPDSKVMCLVVNFLSLLILQGSNPQLCCVE